MSFTIHELWNFPVDRDRAYGTGGPDQLNSSKPSS